MPKMRVQGLLIAAAAVPFFIVGCSKPPEVAMGSALSQEGVSVTVTGYEVAFIDVETNAGAVRTEEPVLLVNITVNNGGESPIQYDLGWNASSVTQEQSVLLLMQSGETGAESVNPANNIAQVDLDGTYLADPVDESQVIAVGGSLEDVLLFELPPEGATRLVLSFPPRLFGAEASMPGYVTLNYAPPEAIAEPASVGVGQPYQGAEFSFTVNSASLQYIPLTQSSPQDEGFSQSPLLRVDFTVTNTIDENIAYTPPRLAAGIDQPQLTETTTGLTVPRALFGSNYTVTDQITSSRPLPPQATVTDFWLFNTPSGNGILRLNVPGQRFGGTGLVRVDIPYTATNVPEPAEWADPEPPAPPTPAPVTP